MKSYEQSLDDLNFLLEKETKRQKSTLCDLCGYSSRHFDRVMRGEYIPNQRFWAQVHSGWTLLRKERRKREQAIDTILRRLSQ